MGFTRYRGCGVAGSRWPSPGVMQAFFKTKDTDSGLGAGTILGGCLGLPPLRIQAWGAQRSTGAGAGRWGLVECLGAVLGGREPGPDAKR